MVALEKNAYYTTAFIIQHLKYFCTCLFISVVYLVKEKLAMHLSRKRKASLRARGGAETIQTV